MLFGKYRFRTVLEEDTRLPVFKGSAFRGAFGLAFRKVTCAVRQKDCQGCILFERCLYARTFEAKRSGQSGATAPNPYLFEPPRTEETRFAADSKFDFDLALFGTNTEYLPYYILALERMGELGVGKSADGKGHGRFRVRDVLMHGRSIYDPREQKLSADVQPERLAAETANPSKPGELTVSLETPLRIKHQNRLTDDLPFYVLIKAVLRRISSLFSHYGEGEPDLDFPGLVNRAKEVKMTASDLRWKEQKRYSGRQGSVMLFGGLVGSATYSGDISEYLPLLDLARKLHVGKQATFGLGLIDYEWREQAR
jgi:hypothetical protein